MIQAILNRTGHPLEQRLKETGEHLIEWMVNHGRIIQAEGTNQTYYLWRDKKKLLKIDSDQFRSWLYLLTSVNPSSRKSNYLYSDCQAAGFDGDKVEVCKLAHWDGNYLRVSSFDGNVWRLDGQTIEQEANGDGPVLFDDEDFTAYTANLASDGSSLAWWRNLLHAQAPAEQFRLGLLAYLCGIFFSELCPTRPILLVQGEKGSGKSMAVRITLKLLFGKHEDVFGVPDREEAFATAASNTLLMVIDNLDEVKPWLRDKLARMSTGAKDPIRVLYKTNELMTISFRTWIAITARTPDTLRRDDLADRLLILPVDVLPLDIPERLFLDRAERSRDDWWGDVLQFLNRMVANIRAGKLPQHSPVRMADFEALGRLAAITNGQEDVWDAFVTTWTDRQKEFLVEDSIIADVIAEWLKDPLNRGREVTVRTLYIEAEEKMWGARPNRPDQNWPKSAVWFGRQLSQTRRSLRTRFVVDWRIYSGQTLYQFDVIR